jgi:hypothetical protein
VNRRDPRQDAGIERGEDLVSSGVSSVSTQALSGNPAVGRKRSKSGARFAGHEGKRTR